MCLGSGIRDPENTYSGSRILGSKRHRGGRGGARASCASPLGTPLTASSPLLTFVNFCFKFRKGRVCSNPNCVNCNAEPCGKCRRCLNPSGKNKCIDRFFFQGIFYNQLRFTSGIPTRKTITSSPCSSSPLFGLCWRTLPVVYFIVYHIFFS